MIKNAICSECPVEPNEAERLSGRRSSSTPGLGVDAANLVPHKALWDFGIQVSHIVLCKAGAFCKAFLGKVPVA